jgi:hypothetical protein
MATGSLIVVEFRRAVCPNSAQSSNPVHTSWSAFFSALAKDISSQAKYRAAKTTKVVITTIMNLTSKAATGAPVGRSNNAHSPKIDRSVRTMRVMV